MRLHNKLLLLLTTLFIGGNAVAQNTAQVQIIHNSPDGALSQVDIYDGDGNSLVSGLSFQDATGFTSINFSGSSFDLGIAPAGSPVGDTVGFTLNNLNDGGQYVVVANGILPANSGSYNDFKPLGLDVKTMARQSANNSGNVDVLVHHGSPGAGAVDVAETEQGLGTFLTNVPYGAFSSYQELPAQDYQLEILPAGTNNVVGRFDAPLAGQDGNAVTVFASGFLNPSANNNGPGFGLYAALPDGTVLELTQLKDPKVQIVHNVADPAADTVDVYVNGNLQFEDFTFRDATPFVTLPANQEINVGIAPPNTSVDDTLKNFNLNLSANTNYIAVANGIVSESGFNPDQPFELSIFPTARTAANSSGNTDVLIHHGSTDAPSVDIVETQQTNNQTIVTGLAYPGFSSYTPLTTLNYTLEVQQNGNEVARFKADLQDLNLTDSAIMVFASGFLNPSDNQNGPAFGLYAVLPSGNVVELPQIRDPKVQIVHNVADPAADTVDVYVNGNLQFEDFSFRQATPFVTLPANQTVNVGIAPANTSVGDTLENFSLNLSTNTNYIAVANGIVSQSGFDPNRAFELSIYSGARTAANTSGNTDVLVHHGSTDAPNVDIVETKQTNNQEIAGGLAYGNFQGYVPLTTLNYTLEVKQSSNENKVASFDANLENLNLMDSAIMVFASGFLEPSDNSDGPGLGLYAATPSGTVVELSKSTGLVDAQNQIELQTYPNPTNDEVRIRFGENKIDQARIDLLNMKGQLVNQKVTPTKGDVRLNMNGLTNGTYIIRVAANGKTLATQRILKR